MTNNVGLVVDEYFTCPHEFIFVTPVGPHLINCCAATFNAR